MTACLQSGAVSLARKRRKINMSIVKESVGGQRGSGGERTVSVVVSSSDEVIIAVASSQDSNTGNLGCDGITRDGQAFTRLVGYGGNNGSGQPNDIEVFYLVNPNTGTADAVAGFNATINDCTVTFYVLSGADADDLFNGYDGDSASGFAPAMSVTTDVDNCFLLGGLCSESVITGIGSGQTQDADYTDQSFENTRISSEAGGSAGAQAHSYNMNNSAAYAQIMVAINPSVPPPTATGNFFAVL